MKSYACPMRLIISLFLAVCLCLALPVSSAFADVQEEFYCNEDEYFRSSDIDMLSGISETKYVNGFLPAGIKLVEYDSYYVLEGRPQDPGHYYIQYEVTYEDGTTDILDIDIFVEASAPAPTASPTPSEKPSPSPTPTAKPKVKITKQPTGESVFVGGRAVFISRADNADSFVWRIVSPDTNTTVEAHDGPSYFSGLKVSGDNTDRLVLENIPLSMDGWKAECKFFGEGGPVYSNGAVIHVSENALKAPEISSQPQGLELKAGSTATLSFSAKSPDGAPLSYQWYSGTDKSNSGGTKIAGANSNRYQPPEQQGTVYYYAAVWASDGNRTSPTAYTKAVPIKYVPGPEPAATPAPSPSAPPTQTPAPDEPDYGGTAIEEEELEIQVEPEKEGPDLTVILIIILCVLLAVVVVCLVLIYIKGGLKKNPPPELPEEDNYNGLHDGINDEADYENYKKNRK